MSQPKFPKHLMPYVELAKQQGWTVGRTKKNHIQFRPPTGSPWPIIVFAQTSSDHRSDKNSISLLAQCGVVLRKG